jgi:hypothetical protein
MAYDAGKHGNSNNDSNTSGLRRSAASGGAKGA